MKKIVRGTLAAILSFSIICATAFAETTVDLSQFSAQSEQSDPQNNTVEAPTPSESKIHLA